MQLCADGFAKKHRCRLCHEVSYCSQTCAATDWRDRHKEQCLVFRELLIKVFPRTVALLHIGWIDFETFVALQRAREEREITSAIEEHSKPGAAADSHLSVVLTVKESAPLDDQTAFRALSLDAMFSTDPPHTVTSIRWLPFDLTGVQVGDEPIWSFIDTAVKDYTSRGLVIKRVVLSIPNCPVCVPVMLDCGVKAVPAPEMLFVSAFMEAMRDHFGWTMDATFTYPRLMCPPWEAFDDEGLPKVPGTCWVHRMVQRWLEAVVLPVAVELDKKVNSDIHRLQAAGMSTIDKAVITESALSKFVKKVEKEFIWDVETLRHTPPVPYQRLIECARRAGGEIPEAERRGSPDVETADGEVPPGEKKLAVATFEEAVTELKKMERTLRRAHDSKSTANGQASLSSSITYMQYQVDWRMWPALLKETDLYGLISLRVKPGNKNLANTCNEILKRLREAEKVISRPINPSQVKADRVYLDISVDGKNEGRLVFKLYWDITPLSAAIFAALCSGSTKYSGYSHAGSKGYPLCYVNTHIDSVIESEAIYGGYLDSAAAHTARRKPRVSEGLAALGTDQENALVPPNNPGQLALVGVYDNKKKYVYGSRFFITASRRLSTAPLSYCVIGELDNGSGLSLVDRISTTGGQQVTRSDGSPYDEVAAAARDRPMRAPRVPVVITNSGVMTA
mmetsp:Transcript_33077/g.95477  ORF Transcript_33077/g.95477 Transcript_33077/m.95477 type:complete len:679 (-) Transcript_33077:392-2428(-)